MPIDKTKVLSGSPYSISFLDVGDVEVLGVTGIRNRDTVAFSAEPVTEELEDGSTDLYGYNVNIEFTYSEIVAGTLNAVQNAVKAKITLIAKGKIIENATAFLSVIPSLDNFKSKIVATAYVPGNDWNDIFTISDVV